MNWHEYFIYKDGDLIWKERSVNQYKTQRGCSTWNKKFAKTKAGYTVRAKGRGHYRRVNFLGSVYQVSRVVWEMHNGTIPKGLNVCHADNCAMNSHIENLFLADNNALAKNNTSRESNTTLVKGVCWDKRQKKWVVRIGVNGKNMQIGYYSDIEKACRVRKEAEKKYWGTND